MFQALSSVPNKGISAFIALAVMTTLLLMAFGLVSIVSPQIKMTGEIGKSVIAFHAADSGIERLAEAIFVGYDYYYYPTSPDPYYGECKEIDIGEGVMKNICDYTKCKEDLVITFNDSIHCGLPSKCRPDTDADCICPRNKCIGYNYYDYLEHGSCDATCNGEDCCTDCNPSITVNYLDCGYDPERMESCTDNTNCPCPISECIGSLEPDAVSPDWETPYSYTLPNGATYKTYIINSNSIKSIGTFKGVKRAIEVSF